jgi:putative flippase GtrA
LRNIINKITEKAKVTKFFRYVFFGAGAALVELASFYVITSIIGVNYIIAAPISFILAAITNYILQKKFTFNNTYREKHKQFLVFILISIGGLLINWSATIIYVELIHIVPLISKAFAIATALVYNYTMNKKITFGKMK